MPKGTKEPTSKKSIYVKFEKEGDLALYEQLVTDAEVARREVSTLVLLFLLDHYNHSKNSHEGK